MATKTYDPKKYSAVLAGIPINEGLAEDTWFTFTAEADSFEDVVGVDGEVTRVRIHDKRATVELTVASSSEVNDRLTALLIADENSTNGEGVGAFSLIHDNGTDEIKAGTAWIMRRPDIELARGPSETTWTIRLGEAQAYVKGSIADSN